MFTNSKLLSFEEGIAQQNDIEIYYAVGNANKQRKEMK